MLAPMHCFPHLFSVTQKIINKQHHKNKYYHFSLAKNQNKTTSPSSLPPSTPQKNTIALMHLFLFICFQHLNFVLFHLLESTITLHLQHYFLSTIEQTKKEQQNVHYTSFQLFFLSSMMWICCCFCYSVLWKKNCLYNNSITKKNVPSFTLYYLNMLSF